MKTKIIILSLLFCSSTIFSQKKWTLKECIKYALENNISIKDNKLNIELAKRDISIAKGNFLPNFKALASQNLNFGSYTGQDGGRISKDTRGNRFGVSSDLTIFNGFRNLNSYKQAKLGFETSRLDLEKIENDISINVLNSYLNVLFAKENLKVAQVQSEISKRQIESIKAKFNSGVVNKGELLNVQSTAFKDIQKRVIQQNNLDMALLKLAQLLQLPMKGFDIVPIQVDSASINLLYDSPTQVYKKALSNRPEIKRAKLNIENSNLKIKIAKGTYLPSLSFSASANTSYQTVLGKKDVFRQRQQDGSIKQIPNPFFKQLNNNLGYYFGLSLSIPIFNRFRTKNDLAKSVIDKKRLEIKLESEKLKLRQTIEQAFLDAKAAAKNYQASKVSLKAQEEAFKNAQENYNYGAMTLFDFDQVRSRLVNAQGEIIRAKYDYIFKTKVLKFYFGESIIEE